MEFGSVRTLMILSLLSLLGVSSLPSAEEVSELWVARYDGPAAGKDSARALAVDGEGNVYVTGSSEGQGTGLDYVTVKYSSEGEELWVARYDGPESLADEAGALALDSDASVYVTGLSRRPDPLITWDHVTVKYSSGGAELWVARYDGPEGGQYGGSELALDRDGNVYVAGFSGGNLTRSGYTTAKYGPEGEQLWVVRYVLPDMGKTLGGLAVDSEGNVYVTGSADAWGMGQDYVTVKYSPEGEELWVARYDGDAIQSDHAQALTVDTEGNVFVTGSSWSWGTGWDYATVKYGPEGEELWTARYDGPAGGHDHAEALAPDSEGNVYVTGTSGRLNAATGYATVKYSPQGGELWVARYHEPTTMEHRARALALDSDGNVYVTGRSGLWRVEDYATTVKYSPQGEELWVVRYDEPGGGEFAGGALAIDSGGNVYVTGDSLGDYATVKYSQSSWVLPSDVNADAAVNIADGVALLGRLFLGLGAAPPLPCGDGTLQHSGNVTLADANGDDRVSVSDGIYVFSFLFLAGPAPALGTECVSIAGCPDACGD